MSKPKDPVIAVINYFENADLPLAQQTLAIVQAIVRNRQPRAGAAKKPVSKQLAAAAAAARAEPMPLA